RWLRGNATVSPGELSRRGISPLDRADPQGLLQRGPGTSGVRRSSKSRSHGAGDVEELSKPRADGAGSAQANVRPQAGDGAIGGHAAAVQASYRAFRDLAERIAAACQFPLPSRRGARRREGAI